MFILIFAQRAVRVVIIVWRNFRGRSTKVEVGVLANDLIWMKLHTPYPWNIRAGQHVFLSIPSIGLWTSHPFSIAWADGEPTQARQDHSTPTVDPYAQMQEPALYFLVKCQDGFTRKLYKRAEREQTGTFTALAYAEGPYGEYSSHKIRAFTGPKPVRTLGIRHSLSSFRSVILVAGGVGVTHQLLYLKKLIAGYEARTAAVRRVVFAWSITSIGKAS